MKKIRVTIKPGGKFVVETEGYVGAECKDASRAIEAALGVTVTDTPTPEMYNDPIDVERGVGR